MTIYTNNISTNITPSGKYRTVCGVCDKEFKSYNGLAKHRYKLHKEWSKYRYYITFIDTRTSCVDCGAVTGWSHHLGHSLRCQSCSKKGKLSASYGITKSAAHRQAISDTKRGVPLSKEHKQAIRDWWSVPGRKESKAKDHSEHWHSLSKEEQIRRNAKNSKGLLKYWANISDEDARRRLEAVCDGYINNGLIKRDENMAFKTYKGRYTVKNPKKYRGDHRNVIFRSGWEKAVMIWCDKMPQIKSWSSEEVIIPYLFEVDQRTHRYFMDFLIEYDTGEIVLVEVKPHAQTLPPTGNKRSKRYITEGLTFVQNRCKWMAAEEYVKDRGWRFEIWTEKHLRAKNILTKSLPKAPKGKKQIKPLGRLRVKKDKPNPTKPFPSFDKDG